MRRDKTISLDNLTIGYQLKRGYKYVAQEINASVYSGELTCLLGANGIGKSTLLRSMTANQPLISGSIRYLGRELSEYSPKMLSQIISIVLTDKVNIKNLSVTDLVGVGRSPYTGFWGTTSAEDRKIIEEAIEMVGVTHLSGRMIQTLSDGERQKTMIAKALAQQTPIILLDEPTAFLDFPSKVEMMQLLHRLSRQTNKTIFLSTHDLDLALQIADRIWLMDGKSGMQMGTPEDLSLDGSLSSFFERKGIAFDPNSGLFRVDNNSQSEVQMLGEGYRFQMARKALLRNGIGVNSEARSQTRIEVGESDIRVTISSGESFVVHSIEELLNIIVA
ncbi:MAG: ABC transporter ATP-binding protein [Rikenellaceae bacterium]